MQASMCSCQRLFSEVALYLCPCPSTSRLHMDPMESLTTSVRHKTRPVYLAQKHERLTGAESVENGVPVRALLGGIMLGPCKQGA